MIRIEQISMFNSRQKFIRITREGYFYESITLDMGRNSTQEQAVNHFERMARMEKLRV